MFAPVAVIRFMQTYDTMSKRIILSVFAITITLNISSQVSDRDLFTSPLYDTPSLSASFAELRSDHFHSGLDYKTGGVSGKEVHAADQGYVYRIAVSSGGFGKALYIRHSSGYSSVYAHLNNFRPDIEEYVKEMQYEKKSFSISLFPARNQFRVERGEVIAWSGNTGGSSGPHLHFEIRESSSEKPVNPLAFGLGISDRVRPVIERIIIYPLDRNSSVYNSHGSLTLKAVALNGSYGIESKQIPVIYGETGFGIKCWDSFDNSRNRCGIYSLELLADGMKVYGFTADGFAYSESRYVNSHIDFSARALNNEYIHRLYLQPGNRLSMYNGVINRGVLSFGDDREHEISIIVTDIAGNRSWVYFKVRSVSEAPVPPAEVSCTRILPYGKAADFTADGIRIHFPAGSFYDTLFFRYDVMQNNGKFLSPIHSVHDETVAVHEKFRLSIKPDTIPAGMEKKLCLAYMNRKGVASYAGGSFQYGYVTEDLNVLGNYAVIIDTVPPVIKPSFTQGADLSGRHSFTVTISDEFSGIGSYETTVDGEWFLGEYDAKNNLLIFRPAAPVLKDNTIHQMELIVTDNCGNKSVMKREFRW
jgi:hypothetical protein